MSDERISTRSFSGTHSHHHHRLVTGTGRAMDHQLSPLLPTVSTGVARLGDPAVASATSPASTAVAPTAMTGSDANQNDRGGGEAALLANGLGGAGKKRPNMPRTRARKEHATDGDKMNNRSRSNSNHNNDPHNGTQDAPSRAANTGTPRHHSIEAARPCGDDDLAHLHPQQRHRDFLANSGNLLTFSTALPDGSTDAVAATRHQSVDGGTTHAAKRSGRAEEVVDGRRSCAGETSPSVSGFERFIDHSDSPTSVHAAPLGMMAGTDAASACTTTTTTDSGSGSPLPGGSLMGNDATDANGEVEGHSRRAALTATLSSPSSSSYRHQQRPQDGDSSSIMSESGTRSKSASNAEFALPFAPSAYPLPLFSLFMPPPSPTQSHEVTFTTSADAAAVRGRSLSPLEEEEGLSVEHVEDSQDGERDRWDDAPRLLLTQSPTLPTLATPFTAVAAAAERAWAPTGPGPELVARAPLPPPPHAAAPTDEGRDPVGAPAVATEKGGFVQTATMGSQTRTPDTDGQASAASLPFPAVLANLNAAAFWALGPQSPSISHRHDSPNTSASASASASASCHGGYPVDVYRLCYPSQPAGGRGGGVQLLPGCVSCSSSIVTAATATASTTQLASASQAPLYRATAAVMDTAAFLYPSPTTTTTTTESMVTAAKEPQDADHLDVHSDRDPLSPVGTALAASPHNEILRPNDVALMQRMLEGNANKYRFWEGSGGLALRLAVEEAKAEAAAMEQYDGVDTSWHRMQASLGLGEDASWRVPENGFFVVSANTYVPENAEREGAVSPLRNAPAERQQQQQHQALSGDVLTAAVAPHDTDPREDNVPGFEAPPGSRAPFRPLGAGFAQSLPPQLSAAGHQSIDHAAATRYQWARSYTQLAPQQRGERTRHHHRVLTGLTPITTQPPPDTALSLRSDSPLPFTSGALCESTENAEVLAARGTESRDDNVGTGAGAGGPPTHRQPRRVAEEEAPVYECRTQSQGLAELKASLAVTALQPLIHHFFSPPTTPSAAAAALPPVPAATGVSRIVLARVVVPADAAAATTATTDTPHTIPKAEHDGGAGDAATDAAAPRAATTPKPEPAAMVLDVYWVEPRPSPLVCLPPHRYSRASLLSLTFPPPPPDLREPSALLWGVGPPLPSHRRGRHSPGSFLLFPSSSSTAPNMTSSLPSPSSCSSEASLGLSFRQPGALEWMAFHEPSRGLVLTLLRDVFHAWSMRRQQRVATPVTAATGDDDGAMSSDYASPRPVAWREVDEDLAISVTADVYVADSASDIRAPVSLDLLSTDPAPPGDAPVVVPVHNQQQCLLLLRRATTCLSDFQRQHEAGGEGTASAANVCITLQRYTTYEEETALPVVLLGGRVHGSFSSSSSGSDDNDDAGARAPAGHRPRRRILAGTLVVTDLASALASSPFASDECEGWPSPLHKHGGRGGTAKKEAVWLAVCQHATREGVDSVVIASHHHRHQHQHRHSCSSKGEYTVMVAEKTTAPPGTGPNAEVADAITKHFPSLHSKDGSCEAPEEQSARRGAGSESTSEGSATTRSKPAALSISELLAVEQKRQKQARPHAAVPILAAEEGNDDSKDGGDDGALYSWRYFHRLAGEDNGTASSTPFFHRAVPARPALPRSCATTHPRSAEADSPTSASRHSTTTSGSRDTNTTTTTTMAAAAMTHSYPSLLPTPLVPVPPPAEGRAELLEALNAFHFPMAATMATTTLPSASSTPSHARRAGREEG